MSYFYGPIFSRRLGFSLGLNLVPKKTCSFDCLYCQVGINSRKFLRRFWYIDFNKFKKELKGIIKNRPRIDYITISGSGEPTLHKGLDKLITAIKKITKGKYPVCVITNSSLLYRKDVRLELKNADLIIPSLDAATASTFYKINKPHKKITFRKVVAGLIGLRKEFEGKIWLEIMLLKGINDTLEEAKEFKKLVEKIKPDKVQFNLPVRPTPIKVAFPAQRRIEQIRKIIACKSEVVI